MKCPHCNQMFGGRNCPACGTVVLDESIFCHHCGSKLAAEIAEPSRAEEEAESDFSQRILCSDGTCIGVVNEAGICKVCGKPYAGDPK